MELSERVTILSKSYAAIQMYFAHWQSVPGLDFEAVYQEALNAGLAAESRREFDLIMMEFLGHLRNGHTYYNDPWLKEEYGQPLGFDVRSFEGGIWAIQSSEIGGLHPGSVIRRIGDHDPETLFQQNKKYIAASSDREARNSFTDLKFLLPPQITLELEGRPSVTIDRTTLAPSPKQTNGYWIVEDQIGYIQIPAFGQPHFEQRALNYLVAFREAPVLIVDVRGNTGGTTPNDLVQHLMDRPYRYWSESTPAHVGLFKTYSRFLERYTGMLTQEQSAPLELARRFEHASLLWPASVDTPAEEPYTGRLIILIDGQCRSAGEDFVVPFKDSGRATLVGERTMGTTGQPYFESFESGSTIFVSTKRAYLPDGSGFEGIGILPDIEVAPTLDDMLTGRDPVLERALQLASH
jgi:carboxyl-terminal processing protease